MATAELPPARSTELPLEPEMHPLVQNKHDLVSVGDAIGEVVLKGEHPRGWWVGFLAGFFMLQVLALAVCWLFYIGVGIWGINVPVAWGFAIINFVWWIGIGHAGTLISAILLLLHQKWRTSINRFSEAMTIFAVMLDPTVSPASFLLHHVLGADIFAQSIAPGNLPYIFAMIAFWTGAGAWIVVMAQWTTA